MKKPIFFFLAALTFFSSFSFTSSDAEAGFNWKRFRRKHIYRNIRKTGRSIRKTVRTVVQNPRCSGTLFSAYGLQAQQAIRYMKSRGIIRSRHECYNIRRVAAMAASYYNRAAYQPVMLAGRCVCLRVFQ